MNPFRHKFTFLFCTTAHRPWIREGAFKARSYAEKYINYHAEERYLDTENPLAVNPDSEDRKNALDPGQEGVIKKKGKKKKKKDKDEQTLELVKEGVQGVKGR